MANDRPANDEQLQERILSTSGAMVGAGPIALAGISVMFAYDLI